MGRLSSCLSAYMKNSLKASQKKRNLKVFKPGIVSTALFGLVLSASNVFAQPVTPTTNTPYMGSGTSIGVNGQQGNKMNGTSCRAGNGFFGTTGSPNPLNVYQSNLASSGYGTGVYALATGGKGGDGGANTDADCSGANAANGVLGGAGAPVNVWFVNGAVSSTTLSSTGIYAVSGGGNGGDGGRNNQGGNAGSGGDGAAGGAVYVSNTTSIVTGGGTGGGDHGGVIIIPDSSANFNNTAGSYGIYAQSYGGNGGQGGNSTGVIVAGGGGGGGYGGVGGTVTVANSGNIRSGSAIPIFAQSMGGSGAAGGNSTGGIYGGGAGNGGNGASADSVSVSNQGTLTSTMTGGFGINAQSVGGSGGSAGASAGLLSLGASGGQAATGGSITLSNLGAITLYGSSSIGLFAQSVGGGGGSGGLATGVVAIGGSSGGGGGGAAVSVNNTGIINTGYGVTSSTSTNGGAFGILAQSVGGGGGVGGMGISSVGSLDSFSLAVGGSGGSGGSGNQVVVANSNSITTTEPNSAAIVAQSIGGGGGSGGGAVSISGAVFIGFGAGVGGTAGTGGAGGLVGVNCTSSSNSSTSPCYNTPTQSGGDSATGGTIYFTAGSPASDALITTSGVGSPGILAQSLGGGGGNGGYAIQIAAGGDASLAMAFGGKAGAGGYGSNVYATPAGVNISTSGSDSPGLVANSTGGGGGVGGAAVSGSFSGTYSAALSIGGTGGSGGNGSSVTAENLNNGSTWNASSITTTGARSYGIVAQSIGGGGGSGGGSIALSGGGVASLALGLGGTGSVGGDGNVVSLSNDGSITTSGAASSALIAQSIGGGGGNGGFDISGSASMELGGALSVGGRGGKGGTGMNVTLTNSGTLLTQGGGGAVILAQSIGGGGGNGGFSGAGNLSMSGSFGYSIGGSAAAGGTSKPVSVTNSGSITANNTSAYVNSSDSGVVAAGNNPGILAQAIGGNGGNGGVSVGAIISTGVVVGLNVAGSGGTGGGAGDVTVTNSGTASITGPLSSAIIAQSIGGNGGNGGLAAGGSVTGDYNFTSSVGGGGGEGGASGVIKVTNSGALAVDGAMSSAILAQSIGGSGGIGGTAIAGSLLVSPAEDETSASLAISVGGSGGGGATANVVTVTNSAGITATGDQSGGIVAQAIGGSGGTGGNAIAGAATITESDAPLVATLTLSGKGGNAGYANTTTVNVNNPDSGNYTISTSGLLATGILAQSIGGGGGNAGSSFSGTASHSVSSSVSIGSDGGAGGTAGAVNVTTGSGVTISTAGDQSSGIVAQSIGGSGGNGGIAVGAAIPAYENAVNATVSVGGNGSSGGSANTVTVNNSAVINTKGMLSLGIIAQSIGGSGGNGGSTYAAAIGEKGDMTLTLGGGSGSGGTANAVTVNNYNAITTAQSQSTGILAQSIGGVGGNGGISEAKGHSAGSSINIGIGGAGGNSGSAGAVDLYNSGLINVTGNQSFGLVAQSIGGSGGNGGESVSEGAARWGGSIILDVGKNGGAGGAASAATVTTTQNITTNGLNSIGILGQSIGGAGGNGLNSISFEEGGQEAVENTSTFALEVGGSAAYNGTSQGVTITQTGNISTVNPNSSTTSTTNDQAAGIVAQSIGGNGGNGGNAITNSIATQGSISLSIGGEGIEGTEVYGANSNGVVNVYSNQNQTTGSIKTDGMSAPAILAQSIGGGGGNGTWTQSNTSTNSYGVGFSLGGWGGNGGNANQVNVYSGGTLTTTGQQSSAIIAQSIGGGGGNGGVATTQVSSSPGSNTNGLTSVVGAEIDLTGVGSQAATYIEKNEVNTEQATTSNAAPDSGVSTSMAVGGYGANSGTGDAVSVTSSSTINTSGAQANGITAQSIGGGGGIGGSSTSGADGGKYTAALSVGGFGVAEGTASSVAVTNSGSIMTAGDSAIGIFAQSVGGGGGSASSGSTSSTSNAGGAAAVSMVLGGYGSTGGSSGTAGVVTAGVGVTNTATIVTQGINSNGIFAQSVGGGGGNGGSSSTSSNVAANSGSSGSSTAGTGGSSTPTTSNTANSSVAGNTESEQYSSQAGSDVGTAVGMTIGGYGVSGGFANTVQVTNSGTIQTGYASTAALSSQRLALGLSDNSAAIFAQSVGGGGGSSSSATSNADGSKTSVSLALGANAGTSGDAGTVTVNNTGNLQTNGNNSSGIVAQSIGGGGGNSVSSTSTAGTGGSNAVAFGLGGSDANAGFGNTVTVNNSQAGSLINTSGALSHGIFAQSVGGGGGNASAVNNSATTTTSSISDDGTSNSSTASAGTTSSTAKSGVSIAASLGASGGSSGNAGVVSVTNASQITTSGIGSYGIFAQSVGGGGGNSGTSTTQSNSNAYSAAFALGMSGSGSGNGNQVTISSSNSVSTAGDNAIGVFAQSVGGGGGSAGSSSSTSSTNSGTTSVSMALGGTYGASGNGGAVSITNTNSVTTSGTNSIGVFGQSVGGGGGYVASTSSGSSTNINESLLGGKEGAKGNGGAVNISQNGSVTTSGRGSVGIVAQSVGGGGGYASIASKGSGASINANGLQLGTLLTGSGDSNGGAVTVTNNASISTTGTNAVGILAQSVGGGGGFVMAADKKSSSSAAPSFNDGNGYGGAVTVTVNAPISTSGQRAYGVVAQSVGGGGGFVMFGTGNSTGTGKGFGTGGVVTVNVNANITASGRSATAVYTSTLNGSADPFITIGAGSVVSASGGATAIAIDGANNQLVNYGSILAGDALADKVVEILSPGVNDFQNHGTIAGRITNPTATNVSFINHEGARFTSVGGLGFMGSNTFTNKGYFINHSGVNNTASVQRFTGRFDQTSTGILGINHDHNAGLSDLMMLEESGTFNLAGKVQANFINAGYIKPGTTSQTETIRANGASSKLAMDDAFTIDSTAIMSMRLLKSPTKLELVSTANFTPAGLSTFASQVGKAIGTNQTATSPTASQAAYVDMAAFSAGAAGSASDSSQNASSYNFFQAATAQLVTLPTVGDLEQAYNKLAGSAIQAMPQANYQAVTRAVSTVSDRMNTWRVGDSFINTTKNPRALMTGIASMNQPITPNAPQVATGTLAADGGQMPITSLAKSTDARTWITPFGGTSNSNNLAYQVYGGSLGIEAESDDGKMIGGAALTISQSNYTYSSSTTPATPGSATNYGASFYFGVRNQSAYLSAIGYLGGSSGSFTRQLQVMDFNTSTGVSVHSNILSARVEAGYNLLPNPEGKRTLQVTPFVAIAPTQIRQNGTGESFGSLGSGFYYGSNINTAVPVSIGTEISGDLQLSNKEVLRPFVRVSWVHDLMSPMTMSAATTSYGPTLYANGTPTMGNMVVLKGGAKYNLGNKISAYATLDLEQGNGAYNFRGIGGSLGAVYSW